MITDEQRTEALTIFLRRRSWYATSDHRDGLDPAAEATITAQFIAEGLVSTRFEHPNSKLPEQTEIYHTITRLGTDTALKALKLYNLNCSLTPGCRGKMFFDCGDMMCTDCHKTFCF